jgi:hypothetical protein
MRSSDVLIAVLANRLPKLRRDRNRRDRPHREKRPPGGTTLVAVQTIRDQHPHPRAQNRARATDDA